MSNWRAIKENSIELLKYSNDLKREIEDLRYDYEELKCDFEIINEQLQEYEEEFEGEDPYETEYGDFNDWEDAKSEYEDLRSLCSYLKHEFDILHEKYSELKIKSEYAQLRLADYKAQS